MPPIFLKERSKWLIKNARMYWSYGMILAILALTLNCFVFLRNPKKLGEFGIWGLLIAIVVLFLFKYLYRLINIFSKESDNFFLGDAGEIDVENELDKLSDKYYIIPDIKKPNRTDNIDFVVVGPTGIFALEVKKPSHKSEVRFNGNGLTFNNGRLDKDPLHQAIENATVLGEYLKKEMNDPFLFVHPVVVFARPMELSFGLDKIKNVAHVIGKTYLGKLLSKEDGTNLSDQKVNEIGQKIKEFDHNNR